MEYVGREQFNKWVHETYEEFSSDIRMCYTTLVNDKGVKIGVMVIDRVTAKIAISYCNPTDSFNDRIGVAVAYARLKGKPIYALEPNPCIGHMGQIIKYKGPEYGITGREREFYVLPVLINNRYTMISTDGRGCVISFDK